jgi:hypothetical protein
MHTALLCLPKHFPLPDNLLSYQQSLKSYVLLLLLFRFCMIRGYQGLRLLVAPGTKQKPPTGGCEAMKYLVTENESDFAGTGVETLNPWA